MTTPLTAADALPRTLWGLLAWRAEQSPDRLMLLDPEGRRLTFAQVRNRAERLAAEFARLGVREGTPVTWQLPTRIETVIASLALCRLGAAQNPIIHLYREREVGFCIRQTGAEFVLTPGTWGGFDYRDLVERVTADLPRKPQPIDVTDPLPLADPGTLPAFEPLPPGADAPIRWIYYTSGTTSDPKGVQHTDEALIAAGAGLGHALRATGDDLGTIAFPYAHIGGPDYLVAMLVRGFPAVLIERFDPTRAPAIFAELGVTLAGGSTAFYAMLLAEQRKRPGEVVFPTLRALAGGGAPLPAELYDEVRREMGIPIAHGYGMTECPMISQGSPLDSDEQLANSEGAPVPGCAVSIVRADGEDAAPGEQGEVRVTGPMLFRGYTDPRLTRDAFDETGRFRTGDLGLLREDGHVVLTGRLKDVIIRKGENVSALEVEEVLYTHPKVAAVAVIGLPDRERGERVCAVVEPAEDAAPLTLDEMVAHCRSAGLMTQKIPEQLELRDALPRNATLKVLKSRLREELSAQDR